MTTTTVLYDPHFPPKRNGKTDILRPYMTYVNDDPDKDRDWAQAEFHDCAPKPFEDWVPIRDNKKI